MRGLAIEIEQWHFSITPVGINPGADLEIEIREGCFNSFFTCTGIILEMMPVLVDHTFLNYFAH
jgi:hypothetical protein